MTNREGRTQDKSWLRDSLPCPVSYIFPATLAPTSFSTELPPILEVPGPFDLVLESPRLPGSSDVCLVGSRIARLLHTFHCLCATDSGLGEK